MGLLQLICAVPVLASLSASGDQQGPMSSLEEMDDTALLQLQVKPASVSRVLDLPMTSWVISFPRTSSSSTQGLIAEVGDAVIPGPSFTLLEPCHLGDDILDFHNCSEVLDSLVHCDFSKVLSLHSWNTTFQGVVSCCQEPYSPTTASKHCSEATHRTYKTVDVHDLEGEVFPVLDDTTKLRAVNLVRDPRGMYMSRKLLLTQWQEAGADLDPTLQRLEDPDFLSLECSSLANMSGVSHPRLYHVRFEDMISELDTTRNMLQFLGFPWNREVEEIVSRWFPGLKPGSSWCHINHYPGDDGSNWTSGELEVLGSIECQSAFQSWGYPPLPA